MPSKAERGAGCIGAHPGVAFGVSALITTILSLIALFVGEFEVSADNAGWESRTTTMANRQVQFRTLQKCYTLDEDCWMSDSVLLPNPNKSGKGTTGTTAPKRRLVERRLSNVEPSNFEPSSPPPPGCWNAHSNWNDPTIVYRAKDAATSLLSPAGFQQVCELEGQVLEARGYNTACRAGEGSGCTLVNGGACLAPISTTSRLRSATPGGWSMSCAELVAEPSILRGLVSNLALCLGNASSSSECEGASQVGHDFTVDSPSTRLLAAVFPFSEHSATDSIMELHDSGTLAASSADVETAYGQQGLLEGEFYDRLADVYLESDMGLVMGSMGVSLLFLLGYTRSLFMSVVGLVQAGFSCPLLTRSLTHLLACLLTCLLTHFTYCRSASPSPWLTSCTSSCAASASSPSSTSSASL